MRFLLSSALCVLCTLAVAEDGADLPLGSVAAVDGDSLSLRFDADPRILPDSMVGIYGPGKLEKHPLTGQVIKEFPQLVAKAQVLRVAGAELSARVTWRKPETVIETGHDVVPMPSEATPNGPPVLKAAVPSITVPLQGTTTLQVPVMDPEGGRLSCVWALGGTPGQIGRLDARTTVRPEVVYTAPATAGTVTAQVLVRDDLGQQVELSVPITVAELGEGWRQRTVQPYARLGGSNGRGWLDLVRGPAGYWWGVSARSEVVQISTGWGRQSDLSVQEGVRLSPIAIEPRASEIYVLDRSMRAVAVMAYDGVLRRQVGQLSDPTDLAVDDDGAMYVADQRMGGVVVYEPSGQFRVRLGREGEGADAFARLTRICLGPDGTLYCIDAEQFTIQRFDRYHRRLSTWDIQGDRDVSPVDIVWHPSGVLLLKASGEILVYNEAGVANQAYPALSEDRWFDRVREAKAIAVDGSGDIFVTYPDDTLVARYARNGQLSGVRGGELFAQTRFVVDGRGMTYGLDARTGLITAYDPEGWQLYRFAGTEREGGPFEGPGAMAVTNDGSALYVIDTERVSVLRFNLERPNDRPLVFGQRGKNAGQFLEPVSIAVDATGRAYVLDVDMHRVSVFDPQGGYLFDIGQYRKGKDSDEIQTGEFVAVHPDGSVVYVYDKRRYEMMKFAVDQGARSATHVSNAGGRGRELGQHNRPVGMGVDRLGLLYVLDNSREDLQVIDFRGTNAVTVLAQGTEEIGIARPEGLSLTPDGVSWIMDSGALVGLRWNSR